MKNNKTKYILLPFITLFLGGCAYHGPSSGSSYEYPPISSQGAGGYVFNMEDKYTLNTSVKDKIATFGDVFDKEEILALVDLIGLNDFYVNKMTVTVNETNLYDYGDNGNTLDEGNKIETSTQVITRNNANHTLSGTDVYSLEDHTGKITANGVYSLTYSDDMFSAKDVWDYDVDDFDESHTYVLNDEFVDNHLPLLDAKSFLEEMIASSLDDESIFDAKDVVGYMSETHIGISLNRSTLVENYRHDQKYNMVIHRDGYVTETSYSYVAYYGKTTIAPILRESSRVATFEKIA